MSNRFPTKERRKNRYQVLMIRAYELLEAVKEKMGSDKVTVATLNLEKALDNLI